ncbi:response regulator [Paenibacillus sp. 8b26]|uniref:response regulator n=1 Tax=Paenibacillus sp. 8b26 TaxID=3424133 RepID=UPI003D66232B
MSVNLLLVDDEVVDLEWLRRRVLESGLNVRVAGTAHSGFQALKLMKSEPIDLILSDIRMPIMTGTEFARKAKTIHPKVKIVFISGHEDFGYAKEAIEINASGYLLKPVEDQELFRILTEQVAKIEQELEQDRSFTETLSLVNEELLLRWFEERTPAPATSHVSGVLAHYLEKGTSVALVEIDDLEWKMRNLPPEEQRAEIRKISRTIKTFAADIRFGTVIGGQGNRFVILAAVPESSFNSLLKELVEHVNRSTSRTVTIGVGRYASNETELHESFRQALAALGAKWLLGKNRIIQGVIDAHPQNTPGKCMEEKVNRMLEAILDYDLVTIDDCLMELLQQDVTLTGKEGVYALIIRMTSKLHADLQQRKENLYELLEWESRQPDVLFQFETVHDILSWLRRGFFELSEMLYIKGQRQMRKLIEEIMRYVENNLEKKITLKEVAAHLDFTANYLGQLFKEETGTHFSDYLTGLKTDRVCELLKDPTKKIYEIADQMGYKNIIYFNRKFKQAMGMTPGEYRKKHKI